jgi:uncharacterized membrane protein YeaQ/YmgE (transglycosylase-associated protein family)
MEKGSLLMNIFIALVAGLAVGWGSSMLIGTDGREDLIRNVIVGAVGAYLGGWLLTAIFDSAEPADFTIGAIIAAMSGAAIALFAVNRFRRA